MTVTSDVMTIQFPASRDYYGHYIIGWSVGSLLAQGRGTEMSAAPLRCGL